MPLKPTIRASKMDRALNCHGSLTIEEIVAQREGDEGDEGSYLHWMIASRAIKELGAIPPDGGLEPPRVAPGFKLSPFVEWIPDWAIRHIKEVIPPTWSLIVEAPFAYEFDRWTASGHIDILGISPDATESHGIDWKTGPTAVDAADNNEQVLTYIVLTRRAWPSLRRCSFDIAQPRADEDEGFQKVSSVTLEGDLLEAAEHSLDSRVCEALDDPYTLNTGRKQCQWCVGCSCPAIRHLLHLMKMTLTPKMLAELTKTPNDGVLGDFVIDARTLAKAIDDAEALLKERIEKAGYVDAACGSRITISESPSHYSVPNPQAFYQALIDLLPDQQKRALALKFSMTQAKVAIAEAFNVPKTGKSATTAASIFDAKLRPLTIQATKKTLIFT